MPYEFPRDKVLPLPAPPVVRAQPLLDPDTLGKRSTNAACAIVYASILLHYVRAEALALEEVAGLEAELMRAPLRPKAGLAGQQDAGWLEVLQANTSGVAMGRWDAGCIDFLQKQAI